MRSLSRNELLRRYREAAIFVMPSLYEPFGLVAVEAMAHGCAVIATRAGGPCEIIEHEINGLLIEPGCSNGLALAIHKLLVNPSMVASLGEAAKKRVREHFDVKICAQQTLHVYDKL